MADHRLIAAREDASPPEHDASANAGQCVHAHTIVEDDGYVVCSDCGEERENFSDQPEWNSFPTSANDKEAARCRSRPRADPLKAVLAKYGIELPIGIRADVLAKYVDVADGQIARGNGRIGIIAICYMIVLAHHGEYRTSNYIIQKFKIEKQIYERSYQRMLNRFPNERVFQVSPGDLVRWTLSCIGADHDPHTDKIRRLIDKVVSEIPHLKRTSPQALCSAVTFFYIQRAGILQELHQIKEFASRVYLSDITILKMYSPVEQYYVGNAVRIIPPKKAPARRSRSTKPSPAKATVDDGGDGGT